MVYVTYIMRRTQIYLDEAQDQALAKRARAEGSTKSAIIREAIDAHLRADTPEARLARFHAALDAAFGIAPYLPDGAEYVERMRANDRRRQEELDRQWRGDE